MRVHGLRCCRRKILLITWRGAFSASASVEPGLRPFHTARVSRAEAAQKREQRAPIVLSLAASARAQRCAQRTECNGGFGFQNKVKDRFLNQRRWTCWYSCRENMQVLSAQPVLFYFSFCFVNLVIFAVYLTLHYGGFPYFLNIIIIWFLSVC